MDEEMAEELSDLIEHLCDLYEMTEAAGDREEWADTFTVRLHQFQRAIDTWRSLNLAQTYTDSETKHVNASLRDEHATAPLASQIRQARSRDRWADHWQAQVADLAREETTDATNPRSLMAPGIRP